MKQSKEETLKLLHELADAQHPHLAGDNHTRTLIDKSFSGEKLTREEAFDCGKYYQRMLSQLSTAQFEDSSLHLSAILKFKYSVYNKS